MRHRCFRTSLLTTAVCATVMASGTMASAAWGWNNGCCDRGGLFGGRLFDRGNDCCVQQVSHCQSDYAYSQSYSQPAVYSQPSYSQPASDCGCSGSASATYNAQPTPAGQYDSNSGQYADAPPAPPRQSSNMSNSSSSNSSSSSQQSRSRTNSGSNSGSSSGSPPAPPSPSAG